MSIDWSADVAVVGAGPAGSSTAAALARRGVSVVLLDGLPRAVWKIGETLPPVAGPLLHELGVLPHIETDGHLPSYGNLSSWGSAELVPTDFILTPSGHGWQLDRERFDARLAVSARDAGARLAYGCRVVSVRQAGAGWEVRVRTRDGDGIARTRWVVDATGRCSSIARQLGARRIAIDDLVCVYAVAQPPGDGGAGDADTRTLVEAMPDGWCYASRTPCGRTVAWVTDADLLLRQSWREPGWFRRKLEGTRHIREVIESYGYEFPDPIRCTSANSSRIDPWCGSGWLAIGDAALAFDPLASQGLFNALATGLTAARTIASALAGEWTRPDGFAAELEATWGAYLHNRRAYYRAERRWADEAFWTRHYEPRPSEPVRLGASPRNRAESSGPFIT